MVAGAVELDAGLDQPAERIGERRARRIEDGDMVEPGRAGSGRRAAFALPGVQPDVVMIAAGRDEGGARAVALRSARSRARRNRRRARARCRRPSDAHGRCGFPDRSERRVRFPRCGLRWVCRAWLISRLDGRCAPVAVTWRKPARLAARAAVRVSERRVRGEGCWTSSGSSRGSRFRRSVFASSGSTPASPGISGLR